jgi:hypothetical protein
VASARRRSRPRSASTAAARGRKTIVCEVAEQDRISRVFRREGVQRETEVQLEEGLWAISIDPRLALEEWLGGQLHNHTLVRTLTRSNAFQYFVAAAPGAKELITIGKIWELAQLERWNRADPTYDLVIVDAPASGHGIGMLHTPQTFGEIARVGPVKRQATKIRAMLSDPARTAYVAVTLGEEMPVNETIELDDRLQDVVGLGLDVVVVNALYPERFTKDEAERLRPRREPTGTTKRAPRRSPPRWPSTIAPSCNATTCAGSGADGRQGPVAAVRLRARAGARGLPAPRRSGREPAGVDGTAGRRERPGAPSRQPSADAEAVEHPLVRTPGPAHADGQVQVHGPGELALDLLARRRPDRLDHLAVGADQDALLGFRLGPHRRANRRDVAGLLDLVHLDFDRMRHLLPRAVEHLLANQLGEHDLLALIGALVGREVERALGKEADELVDERAHARPRARAHGKISASSPGRPPPAAPPRSSDCSAGRPC